MKKNLMAALALGVVLAATPALAFEMTHFKPNGLEDGTVNVENPKDAPAVNSVSEWNQNETAKGAKGGEAVAQKKPAQLVGEPKPTDWWKFKDVK